MLRLLKLSSILDWESVDFKLQVRILMLCFLQQLSLSHSSSFVEWLNNSKYDIFSPEW